MPSLLSRIHNGSNDFPRTAALLPSLLLAASLLANTATDPSHSLLTTALAWTTICALTLVKSGPRSLFFSGPSAGPARKVAWSAGALFALVAICERALETRGTLWAEALLPFVVWTFLRNELAGRTEGGGGWEEPASPTSDRADGRGKAQMGGRASDGAGSGSRMMLLVLSGAGVVATFASSGSNAAIALGLCVAVVKGWAFLLVERARFEARSSRPAGGSVIYSANGLLSQPGRPAASGTDAQVAVLRDMAVAAAAATGVAAFMMENYSVDGLSYWNGKTFLGISVGTPGLVRQGMLPLVYAVALVPVHVLMDGALVFMIQRQGTFLSSFVPLAAAICSQLLLSPSLSRMWFGALCFASSYVFLDEHETFSGSSRIRLRVGKILTLVAIVSFGVLAIFHLGAAASHGREEADPDAVPGIPPTAQLEPLALADTHTHPIEQLVHESETLWQKKLDSQSKTLEEAVVEYKRRYGTPPPPNFDKWFELAKQKDVQLVDEFDTIHQSLLPFWAISPATIRERAREAIGYEDNQLMGILIRDGKASHVEGGPDWLQNAAIGMMEKYVQYLPDMDLAFNLHDEPRVVVPHDELARLVDIAQSEKMPAALANGAPKNAFSKRPADVNGGKRMPEARVTRFNVFAHQPTWLPSRLSCPPDSPARALEESSAADNLTSYALSDLGFVYNHTASSDICNSPSLAHTYGFFDRPNAFNVVHDLFPIFSQSKMSSFQDILYPSPWYWDDRVAYDKSKDMDWEHKSNSLWWRGSTTGGFSRDGGWRRQHRQHLVRRLNAPDTAKVLPSPKGSPDFSKTIDAPRKDFSHLVDVHFSHVGQCDPGDCDAQREFFTIAEPADQQDAWKYRFLLDMDGNAFSGRFYAFLASRSLTFKMAIFREWHAEWIKPWVHYVPLSLRGDEALESVRYLGEEEDGGKTAEQIARNGRKWARKALRREDFEVWFFRLLLEYGRLVDDNREQIGYSGS